MSQKTKITLAVIHRTLNTILGITIVIGMFKIYQIVETDIETKIEASETKILEQCEDHLFEKIFMKPAPSKDELAMVTRDIGV